MFKAAEPDEKGNVVYVHALLPATPGFDYRPSLLLDELLDAAPPELLSKYRDAFAVPPTKLSLTEFANMAVAPLHRRLLRPACQPRGSISLIASHVRKPTGMADCHGQIGYQRRIATADRGTLPKLTADSRSRRPGSRRRRSGDTASRAVRRSA